MRKRILSGLLVVMLLLLSLTPFAYANGLNYENAHITVDVWGNQFSEDVLQSTDGTIYVPITWLSSYGLMDCKEESDRYVFYNVGEETNKMFAKRIFIDKSGDSADYGCYVSPTKFMSIVSPAFSGSYTVNGVLYLPLAEFLPLFNAKTEITDDGILHIYPNAVSLFGALYGLDLDALAFDARDDIIGDGFISATGMIVDTVFNFRFDRLDVFCRTGEIADYNKIFKAYLTDDEVYLSSYDQEKSPEDEYIDSLAEALNINDELWDGIKDITKALKYTTKSEVHERFKNFAGGITDFSDSVELGSDAVEIIYKLVSYWDAYENQIDDHRRMLNAVYGDEYYNKWDSACQAALETSTLYGNDTSERLKRAVESGLREYVVKELPEMAVEEFIAPYQIAFGIAKLAMPEGTMEAFEDSALLYYMDGAVQDACDVFDDRSKKMRFDTESLNDLRLTAMMALIASRYAYNTYMGDDYSKKESIDEALKLIYLSADSVECESEEYYAAKKAELSKRVKLIPSEQMSSLPYGSDVLVGDWYSYSYDTVSNGMPIDVVAWDLSFRADGTVSAGIGYAASEPLTTYQGIWLVEAGQGNSWQITLELTGEDWSDYQCISSSPARATMQVTKEGDSLQIDLIESDNFYCADTYERDLDYSTWLDRWEDEHPDPAPAYVGTWVDTELPIEDREYFRSIRITEQEITCSFGNETYGPYTYNVSTKDSYTFLLIPDEGIAFVLINDDMLAICEQDWDARYPVTVNGIVYDCDFWTLDMVFMRQGAGIRELPWDDEMNDLVNESEEVEDYLYYPASRVLHFTEKDVSPIFWPLYVYPDGSEKYVEYMEGITLNCAENLHDYVIYTNSNFVITDNQ